MPYSIGGTEMDDAEIDRLEKDIPTMAEKAFADARQKSLDSGNDLVETVGDSLYRISPSGSRIFIRKIRKHICEEKYFNL